MERRIVLWGVIVALFIVAIFLTIKTGSVEAVQTTAQAAGGVTKSVASSSSGMVGGC